jgi:hypothetical protein
MYQANHDIAPIRDSRISNNATAANDAVVTTRSINLFVDRHSTHSTKGGPDPPGTPFRDKTKRQIIFDAVWKDRRLEEHFKDLDHDSYMAERERIYHFMWEKENEEKKA